MINLTFSTEDHKISGFKCEGHARYAPPGQDIVCAAVSSCLIGAVEEVRRYCPAKYAVSPGLIDVEVKPTKATQILMEYALHTMQNIEEQYPEYLKITIE